MHHDCLKILFLNYRYIEKLVVTNRQRLSLICMFYWMLKNSNCKPSCIRPSTLHFIYFATNKNGKNFIPMRKCRYIYIIWCGMKSKLAQINFQRIKLLTSVIKLAAADTKGTKSKMHWATLNSCDNWVKYNQIQ